MPATTVPRVAIIGAGPAGITAGYELAKRGIPVEIFEASSEVGGLARTIDLWGQKIDIGPHRFFSTDSRVNSLWLEVARTDYSMVNRLTRIYYRGKFFHYPLQPINALLNLGPIQSALCLLSYFFQKNTPPEIQGTFESWVVSRFGRKLFEIFFKNYSEKLWGITCRELDADFAAQRIKKLSLWEAVLNAFGAARGKHKTLVDQFAYPHGGTGAIYQRMADSIASLGGQIHLDTPIRRILTDHIDHQHQATALQLTDDRILPFDRIISTMPLTSMVLALPDLPPEVRQAAAALTFRNTIIVYLKVDARDLFPDNWLYVHSPDLTTGRITNFSNWVPHINQGQNATIVALEFWCYDTDALWQSTDDALIALAQKDLRTTGLAGDAPIVDGHVYRIKRCYPVYRRGYREKVALIEGYLAGIHGLSVIGRYGSFKYNNQDHSILMGLLAAENIADGRQHNLWEINTDYDDYQERSTITASGLQISS